MEKLLRIVYISEAIEPCSRQALSALADRASEKNQKIGVTGILLYSSGIFIQCIEGPPQVIRSLYSVIESDRRHTRVMQLVQDTIPKRLFGHWWMGLLNVEDDAPPALRPKLMAMVRDARDGSQTDVVKLLKSFRKLLPAPSTAA